MRNKKSLIIGLIALGGFFLLWAVVEKGASAAFDDPVRQFFYSLRAAWLTPFIKGLTYLGNWQTITALCLALLFIKPTRIPYGVPVSVGAVFVTVLNRLLKSIVQRARPEDILHLVEEGGFSFPSGHSITGMFVYGMLIYLIRTNVKNRKLANGLTVLLAVPMIGIGLSRIYLGVHYPTDVLAGWCLGITTIVAMAAGLKKSRSS